MSTTSYAVLENNSWKSLPPPPGFTAASGIGKVPIKSSSTSASSQLKLKQKRAWELAISPAKQLPMQAIMLYMSGGGVQIFSIGIVFMLLFSPIKAVSSINKVFAPFAASQEKSTSFQTLMLPKLAYVACNIFTISLGLWKCQQMGLLPTGTGDWLAFETRGQPPEITLRS